MMKTKHLVNIALTTCLLSPIVHAAEGGAGHYSPGASASFVDVLPDKPAVGAFNYFTYYEGNAGLSFQIPIAGRTGLGVSATSYADTVGAFWVTPIKLLGADYAPGIALPFVSTDVKAQLTLPGGGTEQSSKSVSGLGDIEFWPVTLSWSAFDKDLHVDFFTGIYAPTGDYQTNKLANPGLAYWTFEPGVLVSYLGHKNGFEFTTYIGYDFNTENTNTGYTSGQVFHIDTTVAQHLPLGKGMLGIGVNGFYLQQTTGDTGGSLGNFEEMTSGVGPVLSYAQGFGKTSFAAEVKWLPQIGTRNTLTGNFIWFKVGVQF